MVAQESDNGRDLPAHLPCQLVHAKALPTELIEGGAYPENMVRFLWRLRTESALVIFFSVDFRIGTFEKCESREPSNSSAKLFPTKAQ